MRNSRFLILFFGIILGFTLLCSCGFRYFIGLFSISKGEVPFYVICFDQVPSNPIGDLVGY